MNDETVLWQDFSPRHWQLGQNNSWLWEDALCTEGFGSIPDLSAQDANGTSPRCDNQMLSLDIVDVCGTERGSQITPTWESLLYRKSSKPPKLFKNNSRQESNRHFTFPKWQPNLSAAPLCDRTDWLINIKKQSMGILGSVRFLTHRVAFPLWSSRVYFFTLQKLKGTAHQVLPKHLGSRDITKRPGIPVWASDISVSSEVVELEKTSYVA